MRIPLLPRWKSWLLIHVAYRDVNRLARAKDVDGLVRLLVDDTPDPRNDLHFCKRAVIALALGDVQSPAAVPYLVPMVNGHERTDVRTAAVIALSSIGGPETAGALRSALEDERYIVRRKAIEGARLDDPDVLADLVALAQTDPHPLIREAAIEALGRTRSDHWVPLLSSAAAADTTEPAVAGLLALVGLQSRTADDAIRRLRRTTDGRAERLIIAFVQVNLAFSRRARRRKMQPDDQTS